VVRGVNTLPNDETSTTGPLDLIRELNGSFLTICPTESLYMVFRSYRRLARNMTCGACG
jgi:hypothetical protein